MSQYPPIILYTYPGSPFAKRVSWYLQLRGIPYKECDQPPILPRPDVAALGIHYRRIPLCAIGRDVYLDTRLILAKLETLGALGYTSPSSSTLSPDHAALQRLLSALTVSGGVFAWAVALLPANLPMFKDPAFIADRTGFMPGGGKLNAPSAVSRAEAVANMRVYAGLLEDTVLSDGREWVLGPNGGSASGPGLADVEAVWPLHWLWKIPGALPADQLSAAQFPRVFAWVDRFDRAVRAAGKKADVSAVKGDEAARLIVGAAYFEEEKQVQEGESVVQALGLKKGDRVVVHPSDWGTTHKDVGSLVSVDEREVVFETKTGMQGSPTVRVHAPRLGFRIVREDQASRL